MIVSSLMKRISSINYLNPALENDEEFLKEKNGRNVVQSKETQIDEENNLIANLQSTNSPNVQEEREESGEMANDSVETIINCEEEKNINFDKLTREWVFLKIIEPVKERKKICKSVVHKIIEAVSPILKSYPNIVPLSLEKNENLTIISDTHGEFFKSTLKIFEKVGYPNLHKKILFLGDYTDRGADAVENLIVLYTFKLLYPNNFFMGRGNHESNRMNELWGFKDEVMKKHDENTFDLFESSFKFLPLGHLVNHKVLCVHAGVGFEDKSVTINDLNSEIIRWEENTDHPNEFETKDLTRDICSEIDELNTRSCRLMRDILWSDPRELSHKELKGSEFLSPREPHRHGSFRFSSKVTEDFCDRNGLLYIIRGHEIVPNGFKKMHDGRLFTIFSCPGNRNKGGFAVIHGGDIKNVKFLVL